jgi:hypothetical protein
MSTRRCIACSKLRDIKEFRADPEVLNGSKEVCKYCAPIYRKRLREWKRSRKQLQDSKLR